VSKGTDEPADVIFITHAHFDHFQPDEIEKVRKPGTKLVAPTDVAKELGGDVKAVRPGESFDVAGIKVETVPAYNTHPEKLQNHPKQNQWVGYILKLGDHRYYHAGDTDDAPELHSIKTDVAFVPIGGTYTMEWSEAAGLVKKIGPKLAVPMHYGFVVGLPSDADRFAKESAPVKVQTLKPVNAFEKTEAGKPA
jgi:L-ascorbate metabolism protein UlaG (beta-lactamase superfamily)